MAYIKGVSKYCDNWRDALNELQVTVEGLRVENSKLREKVASLNEKTGRWEQWATNRVLCSVCGKEPFNGKKASEFNYCPWCGAKMDKGR